MAGRASWAANAACTAAPSQPRRRVLPRPSKLVGCSTRSNQEQPSSTATCLAVVGGVLLVRLLVGRDAAVRLAGLGGGRQRIPSDGREGQEAGCEGEPKKREHGPGGRGSTAGEWQPRRGAAACAKAGSGS